MLTTLLPIRIVESILSKFSDSLSTSCAFLLPFSAMFLTRIRLRDEKAVSVAEKYADIITHKTIIINDILSPSIIFPFNNKTVFA